jgi:DNA (cytosine-5)-methyltransferase 1
MKLRFVDLFAGVGGLSEGFLKAHVGGQHIFEAACLVDTDASAAYTFQKNHPGIPYLVTDIAALSGEQLRKVAGIRRSTRIDALIGGPPCQGFTILRKNKHLDDPRNALMRQFLRLVGELKPYFVLIENVKNIHHCNDGRFLEEIHTKLARMKYRSEARVLNAHEYGVPQVRERTFIAAFHQDLRVREVGFPAGVFPPIKMPRRLMSDDGVPSPDILSQYISIEEAIGDLPKLRAGERTDHYNGAPFTDFQYARRRQTRILYNHEARAHSDKFLSKLSKIDPGGSNRDLDGRRKFDRTREIKYFSQAYGRLHRDGLAYTITTHFLNPGSGRFIHYRDLRSLTVREAARLQSFDDDFVFYGYLEQQMEQVGNAVPPLLAKSLAEYFAATMMSKLRKGKRPDGLHQQRAEKRRHASHQGARQLDRTQS